MNPTLNGGEAGNWLLEIDPDETLPVLLLQAMSDSDIESLLAHLEAKAD
jgi:hypothetical protein